MRFLVGVISLLLAHYAAGAEFTLSDVSSNDGKYSVHVEAQLNAPLSSVRAVVTDYSHLRWLNQAIRKSELLDHPEPGIYIVYTLSDVCFLFFCHDIEQVQRVDQSDPNHIVIVTLPEYSNLREGRAIMDLKALDATHTFLSWRLEILPDFWIPPVVGPAAVADTLRDQGRLSVRGIEKLARERAGLR